MRHLRNQDYSDQYKDDFTLSADISTRDRDGINKTFSGMMKILFPQGGASHEEIEEVLKLSMEGRKRVKDQLFRIDTTYVDVDFSYTDNNNSRKISVFTLEEIEYPNYFHKIVDSGEKQAEDSELQPEKIDNTSEYSEQKTELKEHHLTFHENQRGVSYDDLFGPYLKGAKHITITDPYIRLYYQARNLMEFLETIVKQKSDEDEIVVSLITVEDEFKNDQQQEYFEQIQKSMFSVGIKFAWSYDNSGTQHARHIVTDTGWKISLDRGLDIFQQYDMNDSFQLGNRLQTQRACKAFEVTYIKLED